MFRTGDVQRIDDGHAAYGLDLRGKSYDIEWAEGVTNERPADKVIAQVCR